MKFSLVVLKFGIAALCSIPAIGSVLNEEPSGAYTHRALQSGPPGLDPRVGIVLTAVGALDREFARYETPFSARFTSFVTSAWWNCVAVYSDDLKDAITKVRPEVPVLDGSLHTTDNRLACVAQAGASYAALSVKGAVAGYVSDFQELVGITVESEIDESVSRCKFRLKCLRRIASRQGYNPTIMGHIVTVLVYQEAIADGWNELGTEGCRENCRPYRDPTGFTPSVSPFDTSPRTTDGWEPLLEDNGLGFFSYQQHVTPHIGQLGKFRFLPESDRASRVAPPPNYTRRRVAESEDIIARMASLDDTKKIQVEIFDDKLLVDNTIIGAFVGKLLTSNFDDGDFDHDANINVTPERLLHFAMTLTATVYDAVVIAWKEKVSYDLVRPTTIIKNLGNGNRRITTWAPGADANSPKTFRSRDFEAYIRVMPHSEYVSGSACIFQGLEDFVVAYLSGIGLDSTSFPIQFPPVAPFESKVESGVVPSAPVQLSYSTIQEMATVGSDSRLNGGMHFADSVPAAKQLCAGIGTIVASAGFDLIP